MSSISPSVICVIDRAENQRTGAKLNETDQVGEPFRMIVELGKVREFATATKSSHSAHHFEAYSTTPPTFLMSAVLWAGPENFPQAYTDLNFERVLHGEQEFIFFQPPPRAGDCLNVQIRLDRNYQKQGRRGGILTFSEFVTEFRDLDGQLVVEARQTYIATSVPAAR